MGIEIITLAKPRPYPPRQSEFTQTFWQSLAQGQLLTTRCGDCGKYTFPPKPICPYCWGEHVTWCGLSGRGVLYSYTTVHAAPEVFAAEVPYDLGIIDLDEGLRVATGITGSGTPKLDAPARAVALVYTDGPLLAFTQDDV